MHIPSVPVRPLLVALGLALPLVAAADPKDDARRHFRAGLEAARAGDFQTALERFLAAQRAYPHPVTLYNIGRAYQDLGDLENALATYELYREAAPDKAADIDPVIAVLRAELSRTDPEPPPSSEATASAEEIARMRELFRQLEALVTDLTTRTAPPPADAAAPDDAPQEAEPTGAPPATAEPLDFQTDAYERVVVTASRFGQAPLDSPSSLTVITADDIRLSGARTLPEVLRRVVGVDTMAMAAGHTDVSLRGFNRELSNKVLVLIDGRSTYLDFIGTTLWATLPVTLEEIERIEVIRGPGSAVYGANAVTGVVNILTRTPGEGANHVQFTGGTNGALGGTALVTGRRDADAWRLSVGWQEHGRWAKEVDAAATDAVVPLLSDDDRGSKVIKANGRLDHTFLDDGLLSVSAGYTDARVEFYNIGALGNFAIDDRHAYVRADLGWGPVLLRAFWNHDTGVVGPWASPTGAAQSLVSPLRADTIDVELSASESVATGSVTHRLFAGVGYRRKHLEDFLYLGDDGPTIDEDHFNAFVNDEASVGRVKLVASLRADAHPLIPLSRTLSPRGAAIWRLREATALRITGGSAFRVPTLVESYMDFRIPSGINGVFIRDFGSRDLLPERILTAEIGLHDESSDLHTADVAVFVNRLDRQIGLAPVTPVALPYDPVGAGWEVGRTGWINTAPVFLGWGLEASAELFPVDGLDLYGTAAVTRYGEQSDGVTTPERSTSLLKATAGAAWRTPWRLDLSGDVQFASAQTWRLREFDDTGALTLVEAPIPARVILSARAAVRPFPDERLELSVQGWNLAASGGKGFREHPKGQPIRSRVTATARLTF